MKKVLAAVVMFLGIIGIGAMYFSSTFVPVYVNGTYVLANQILRYILYIVLLTIIFFAGVEIVSEEEEKTKRRRK